MCESQQQPSQGELPDQYQVVEEAAEAALFGKISHPRKRALLIAYSVCGIVSQSCKAARCSRAMFYHWRQHDKEFADALEDATEMAATNLADNAIERATHGVERLKFDKNGMACIDPRTGNVYVERQYSETLTIFLLKKLDPKRYGDRVEIDGSGAIRVVFEDGYSDNPNYQTDATSAEDSAGPGEV